MSQNHFDKATRYLAKLDPPGIFSWLLGMGEEECRFVRWEDTRAIPFPGETDRIGDTVARLEDVKAGLLPWACALEFQTVPDPAMFGRLMGYLSAIWDSLRPDGERGSHFFVSAVVVNLTGKGQSALSMQWPNARFHTALEFPEWNLAYESADKTLGRIEQKELARCVLPWIPLMQGGDDPAIIDRWKAAAEKEPDQRIKSDFGGLARVLSEAGKRHELWNKGLEGWNGTQSQVVLAWQAEAEARGRAEGKAEGMAEGKAEGKAETGATMLLTVLATRFKEVPEDLARNLRSVTDPAKLESWAEPAVSSATLDEFRSATGL